MDPEGKKFLIEKSGQVERLKSPFSIMASKSLQAAINVHPKNGDRIMESLQPSTCTPHPCSLWFVKAARGRPVEWLGRMIDSILIEGLATFCSKKVVVQPVLEKLSLDTSIKKTW